MSIGFLCLEDAREKIEARRTDYNEYRPHSSLGHRASGDYAKFGLSEAGKLTA
jgi:putative transposase